MNTMKTMTTYAMALLLPAMAFTACGGNDDDETPAQHPNKPDSTLTSGEPLILADPTIFLDGDTYYLYGTSNVDNGFEVYQSKDLKKWEGPVGATNGLALSKADSWGTGSFWAPQVFKHNGKYYMAYAANEQIAIAVADSPKGPFKQATKAQIPATTKEIDPFVFFDEDGKAYLYHDRLTTGNIIFCAQLSSDLSKVEESTVAECIRATLPWENTANNSWGVTEGPTVVKLDGTYYMFYSANDYQLITYAVGVATATSPYGPWTKSEKPLISRDVIHQNGTGHGDLFKDKEGHWMYVFHTHFSINSVQPRRTAIVQLNYEKGKGFSVADGTFRYLTK